MPLTDELLRAALDRTLDETHLDALGAKYEGKVRDNYSTHDGRRFIVVTDRISAFDRVLGTLPLKGQVLNRLAAWWFTKTGHVAKNHVLRVPDPNVIEAIECTPLPVEMVVRAYVTGVTSTSIWTHYAAGKREFCGNQLPDGLKKNQKLDKPILTPSTKAEKGDHDVSASRDEILAMGRITAADFDPRPSAAMRLFDFGVRLCQSAGSSWSTPSTSSAAPKTARSSSSTRSTRPTRRASGSRAATTSASPKAKSPNRSTRSTCAATSPSSASRATAPSRPSPTTCASKPRAATSKPTRRSPAKSFTPDLEDPGPRLRRNLGLS